jgi:polyhydroxyalkanoate synthesis regulator phasin
LQEHWDERARELQQEWDASVSRLSRELDLMVASTKIDPGALERLLGQRKEIDALRRKVEALRREVEALRGVRNGPRRGNGAN